MPYTRLDAAQTLAQAFALLESVRFALVITVSTDGREPRCRLMTPVPHQGSIWFRTRRGSGKIRQLRERPSAAVIAERDGYVAMASFRGLVEVIDEAGLLREPQAPARLAATFEEELGTQRYLLKLVPRHVRYVDHAARCKGEAHLAAP
ncbi:MAG: pyridoxamine 5'-phosphate oxidase family protein [Candidatus Tectomicrobia bacterium]|nr:pyridoxamine 5'-phosphate oxidase family protein [Candidatus Tectomicrobia bacterium]